MIVQFLKKQIKNKKSISRLMMKKAMTYLGQDQKIEIEKYV